MWGVIKSETLALPSIFQGSHEIMTEVVWVYNSVQGSDQTFINWNGHSKTRPDPGRQWSRDPVFWTSTVHFFHNIEQESGSKKPVDPWHDPTRTKLLTRWRPWPADPVPSIADKLTNVRIIPQTVERCSSCTVKIPLHIKRVATLPCEMLAWMVRLVFANLSLKMIAKIT